MSDAKKWQLSSFNRFRLLTDKGVTQLVELKAEPRLNELSYVHGTEFFSVMKVVIDSDGHLRTNNNLLLNSVLLNNVE